MVCLLVYYCFGTGFEPGLTSLITLVGVVLFFHTFIDPLCRCYRTFLKLHCRPGSVKIEYIDPKKILKK